MFDTLGCLVVEADEAAAVDVGVRSAADRNAREVSRSGNRSAASFAGSAVLGIESEWSGGPRPLASRSLAGKPLVDWVLRRASEAELLQEIVVILPAEAGLDAFKETLPSSVTVFESFAPDGLARLCDCLDRFPAHGVVNLRLDSPLLDPCLVDRLVGSVGSNEAIDYATYRSAERRGASGLPTALHAQLGLFAEYIRADVLRKLNMTLTPTDQRTDFSAYIWAHPEEFVLRLACLPRELDRHDLRLALRHQDDWDHAEQIIDALGDDDLDWQRIVGLLQRQPRLRQRMADLNQADLKKYPR